MPTWNPNIPQPGDFPSTSQDELLQNFQSLNTWMGINHVLPDGTSQAGAHLLIQMPTPRGSDPSPLGGVNTEWDIYTKGSSPSVSLYVKRPAGNTTLPGKVLDIGSIGGSNLSTGRYCYLPSGVLIQWGTGSATTSGTSISLPASYSANTQYIIQVTRAVASGTQTVWAGSASDNTASSFKAYSSTGTVPVYWMTIGVSAA